MSNNTDLGDFASLVPSDKPDLGEFAALVPKPPGAMAKVGSRVADLGVTALKGAIGVPETFVGLADLATNGYAGKLAEQAGVRFKDAQTALDDLYSPAQKEANQAVNEAKGFFPTVGAMLTHPSTIVHQALQSAPTMISGGVLARGAMWAGLSAAEKAAVLALPKAEQAAAVAAASKLGPIAAGAIGEGAVTAGQNLEQVRQEDPNGLVTPGQSALMAASGALTGGIGFGSGKLANRMGLGETSTMMAAGHLGAVGAEGAEAAAKKGMLRKIGEGALVEGVGQELPQSWQEQVAQNLAQGKPWDEGAAAAGAQGMLAGGLMGAVAGPLEGGHEHATTTPPPANTVPPGPITAAAGAAATPPGANPPGPMTTAAVAGGIDPAVFPLRTQEIAQKRADALTVTTGVAHQAVPHPTVPNMFAAVPTPPDAVDAGTEIGAAPPAPPKEPFKPGDPVQVTFNGADLFPQGTKITSLFEDFDGSPLAMVEGSEAAVPVSMLTRFDPAEKEKLDIAGRLAATAPHRDQTELTPEMLKAGAYQKGPYTLQGIDLLIENPAGSTRSNKEPDGEPWTTTMLHPYAEIRGTLGADNERIDSYIGPNPLSHHVFVIDQTDPKTGEFDEHKVMLGFNSPEQARAAYDAHYAPDWKGGASMTATTIDGFKEWMKKADTTEAFSPQALEKAQAAQAASPTGFGPASSTAMAKEKPDPRIANLQKMIPEIEKHIADGTVPSWFRSDRPITDEDVLHVFNSEGRSLDDHDAHGGDLLSMEDIQPQIDAMRADPRGMRAAMWDLEKLDQLMGRKDRLDALTGELSPEESADTSALADTPATTPATPTGPTTPAIPANPAPAAASPVAATPANDAAHRNAASVATSGMANAEEKLAFAEFAQQHAGMGQAEVKAALLATPFGHRLATNELVQVAQAIAENGAVVADQARINAGGGAVQSEEQRLTNRRNVAQKRVELAQQQLAGITLFDRNGPVQGAAAKQKSAQQHLANAQAQLAEIDAQINAAPPATPTDATTSAVQADTQRQIALIGGPGNVGEDGKIKSIPLANEHIDAAAQSWGFRPGQFNDRTFGNGRIITRFGNRDELPLLPGVKDGPNVTLAQGPNGKWGYGYKLRRDDWTYATSKDTFFENVPTPDNRPQFDTRQAAFDAAVANIKALANPELAARIDASPAVQNPLPTSAAEHLQSLVDEVARTGQSAIGKVFAPGHGRTGIDKDDNARAKVADDAYRAALKEAGWTLAPKPPEQKTKGETWTKDGQRLLLNHPIVGEPGSLLLQAKPDMVADELVPPPAPHPDQVALENAQARLDLLHGDHGPIDRDGQFQPGIYGTPDQPLRFVSGMSAPGDFTKLFANGKNVGISMRELSKVSIPKIAKALAEARGYLFVDSGAFSVFMNNVRGAEAAEAETQDHARLFDRYEELGQAIGKADPTGHSNYRVLYVMPDIVADQAGSLALVKQYAEQIRFYDAHGIVPLQGGALSLTEAYEAMMRNLGLDPESDLSPLIGIPSQAAAVSDAEFADLMRTHGDRISGVHILGAAADSRLAPRLDALRQAGYDGNVSADANRVRSLLWGGTDRKGAMDNLIQSDMADGKSQPDVVRDDQRPPEQRPLSQLEQRAREAETVEPNEGTTAQEDTAYEKPSPANQDAIDHPEKYAFKGKLPASLIVKRAVEHLGSEEKFTQLVQAHFHELAAEGYPVLMAQRNDNIEAVADSVLAGILGENKPPHYWQHPEFETLPELEGKDFPRKLGAFPEPAKTISLKTELRDAPVLAQSEADAIVAGWKAEAQRIGREQDNSKKVVISLYDRTGVISQPYEDAGYTVFRYDLERGDNLLKDFPLADIINLQESGHEIVGVIAQPPCTSFAGSGAWAWKSQHDIDGEAGRKYVEKKYGSWAAEYFDKPVEVAEFLVLAAQTVVEFANPSQFYVLENPVGRIAEITGLPAPTMRVQPHQFGDPYTKNTQLWGEFNTDLPTALVSAKEEDGGEGSRIHKLRGSSAEGKQERSVTPEGFAYAFFMANHGAQAAKPAAQATAADDKAGLQQMQQAKANKDMDAAIGRLSVNQLVEMWGLLKLDGTAPQRIADIQAAIKQQPADKVNEALAALKPTRVAIATRYAAVLARDGVSADVKDFHYRFADEVLAKDAFRLKWITNGMNDKAKKVFAEFTGVKLPKAQGAAWEAIKAWAGVTPEQEAAQQAREDAANAEKQQQQEDKWAEQAAEGQSIVGGADGKDATISGKQWVDQRIAEGFDAIENISKTPIPRYVLVNKALGRMYPLDKVRRKYAEVALRRLGKSAVAADTDGDNLQTVEQAAAEQAEDERERADAKAKGQTVVSDDDAAHLFGKQPGVVKVPPAVRAALDGQLVKQQARIDKLRPDGGLQLKAAEAALREMRKGLNAAEDAAIAALTERDMALFQPHEMLFRDANVALAPLVEEKRVEREADIRRRIDAVLAADTNLVEHAGTEFKEFLPAYRDAYKQALTGLRVGDAISAKEHTYISNRIDKLPGYISQEARRFIEAHAGEDKAETAQPDRQRFIDALEQFGKAKVGDNVYTLVEQNKGDWAVHERTSGRLSPLGAKKLSKARAIEYAADRVFRQEAAQPDLDALLDDELQAALSDLGDVLGDVFGGVKKMSGPQRTAGDLLPALSKVVELLIRKGYRSFKQAIGMAARAMRGNPKTAPFVDQISPRQWKAAYNAVAEFHSGTDSEADVNAMSNDAVTALVAAPAAEEKADNKATTNDEAEHGQDDTGNQGPQALGEMAAEENGGAEGGRGVQPGNPEGGTASTAGDQQSDGAGVSGARSGGSDAADVHPPETGAEGGLGVARTGKKRKKVSGNDGAVPGGLTPPNIPGLNFRITEALRLGQGGETEKFNDNLAAIRALKAIEAGKRRATPEEQSLLARYVGWGGLAAAFPNPETGKFRDGWAQRGADLEALLSPKEFALARRSTLDAHYTSETVVSGMWQAAQRLGYKGGLALESSVGSGNFLGLMPAKLAERTRFIGVEYDSLTARIAGLLYPQETILHSGFQSVPLPDGQFDLAIGNPPFGNQHLRFQFKPELNRFSIHNQFFLASLEALRPGGLQIQVVSRYLMDAQDQSARIELAKRARLLGAIRLPDTAFKENARTNVVTDIVFLQRLDAAEEAAMAAAVVARGAKRGKTVDAERQRQEAAALVPDWVETTSLADPLGGEAMPTNTYFAANPQMVLGTLERSGSQFQNDITVRPDQSRPLAAQLTEAIARLPENAMESEPSAVDVALERYANLADALQIALAGHEAGSIRLHNDGSLQQVLERETPNGDFELTRRTLTAASPWSEQLQMNSRGQWFKTEAVTGPDGNPLKVLDKDGNPTKRNVYTKKVFADEAQIPPGLLLGDKKYARLRLLVALRDTLVDQLNLEAEDAAADKIEANRSTLSTAYNDFVKEHGLISKPANAALVANMPDGALVQALESGYRPAIDAKKAADSGQPVRAASAKTAAILSKRVIVKYVPPTSAASLADAIAIQTAESGAIDIERIASLLGKSEDETVAEIEEAAHPLLFRDPEAQEWVTRDDYLSGAVKRKLAAARAAGMGKNASELESVLPAQWGAEHVTALIGSTWVPPAVYQDFLLHITGSAARVSFAPLTNSYSVIAGPEVHAKEEEWGSDGISAADIIRETLNSRAIKVMTLNGDNKLVLDEERTKLALLKARAINNEFGDWVFADSERRNLLVETFNDKYNTRVSRQHDGSHLILPGKVPDAVIKMRRHQKNAIWRGISERFMLLDHAVGAGKTYTAIARAMERRRMGIAKKPMIVVPNHMVEQFTTDTYRLYPGAKVLAAGKKDFSRVRRRKLFAKIATGDYDVIIVPHSSFGFIGIAPETELRYLEQELDAAEAAIIEAQDAADADNPNPGGRSRKPFGVKEAERLRDKITARMDRIRGNRNTDKLLTFEQMGVDDLTVDEAHEFKNLFYSSRLTNIKGMGNKTGSQKAFDLYNKVRVLRESPKGAVTFMTGTPISNSAVEMYTMMRYLAADELRDLGLEHFDAWRAQYVSTDAGWEPTETGRLKEVNRLGRTWSNMRSLMDLYYSFTDAVSNDDIKVAYREDNDGAEFPIPKVKGGDRQSVVIQPTPAQIELLGDIMHGFDHLPFVTDPYQRNIERLQLMDRARKVSLDVRAVDPRNPSKEEGGKLDKIADEVTRLYQKWDAERGTQLVFLDRSVPKSKGDAKELREYDALLAAHEQALRDDDEEAQRDISEKLDEYDPNAMAEMRLAQAGGWNAYQQIKDNLVARGIPAHEIRFVQEANNDEQKQALFDAVNDGRVRVLIGSTQRMGAGTNVQQKLVGLHHADVTWKPSDIEQREGRIIRQGNLIGFDEDGNVLRPDFEVEILAYATERTIDAKMWSLNSTKLRAINGIRKYDGAFSMDFEDADSVSMAELAALASGDPLLLERVKLMSEIDNLELLRRQHGRKLWGVVSDIERAEKDIKRLPGYIDSYRSDIGMLQQAWDTLDAQVAKRSVDVEGASYGTIREAMAAARGSMELQQAGDNDAKFTIKIGNSRRSSLNGAHEAIAAVMGERFEATVDGETLIQRVALQRVAAERATELANGLEAGQQRSVRLGTMLGMPLELTVTRSTFFGSYGATLSLLRSNGSTLVAGTSHTAEAPDFATARMSSPLTEVELSANPDYVARSIQDAEERLAEAHKVLPELLPKRDTPFAKQGELDEKMKRLEDVIRLLSLAPAARAALLAPKERPRPDLVLTGEPDTPPRQQRRRDDRVRRAGDPLTETPEFKRWFGDSKMIDGDDKPQRMYHITAKDFSVFKPGGEDADVSGPAIWLTPYKDEQPAAHNTGYLGQYHEGTNVMPVYVKMERPLFIMDRHDMKFAQEKFDLNGAFPKALTPEVVTAIRAAGYDGIYATNFNAAEGYDLDTGRGVEAIVFDGTQLKSAIGNNGQFDANPDIRFSQGADGQGMARDAVQQLAENISAGWENAPPLRVVQSVAELPFATPANTRGVYRQGKVWLVAGNLHSAGEVQFVLAHEALGHAGLRAIMDKDALHKEMNRLRLINPALAKEARAQAAKYGYDLSRATEEALAELAGLGVTINGWQKFMALVQKALRAIGFEQVADWIEGATQAETMALLARARAAIEGKPAAHFFGDAEAALYARTEDGWGRSVRDPHHKEVIKRTPELQAAAQKLRDGKLSKQQYARLVNQYKPVREYEFVPPPASVADMAEALSSDKVGRIQAPLRALEIGHPVGIRLDIPAYANHGVWVVAVHEQQSNFAAGKSIGYDSVAALTNATFGVVQKAALDIAAGKAKSTIAVVKGNWKPFLPEQLVGLAKLALTDPAWRQVGMHPERHAYFFDRGNMRPVVSADYVIQIGPLVLAKNVKYGSMDDVLFSRHDHNEDVADDTLFSRSPTEIAQQVGAAVKGLTITNAKHKAIDYRNVLLQFLGREQLTSVYGELFPAGTGPNKMVQYDKLANQMDADKNEIAAQADKIARAWAKLPRKVADALADLMHDATRLQIDPRKPHQLGDLRAEYDDLKARWDALSPEAKTIFTDAAKAYADHFKAVREAIIERILRTLPDNPRRAEMLMRMENDFFHKIKGVYFPLARFGDYVITVYNDNLPVVTSGGEDRAAVTFAETMAEAQNVRTQLLAKFPPSAGFRVSQITKRAEYNAARDSVGRGFLKQLFDMLDDTGLDPSLQDTINQLYLSSLPDLSWAKHGISRKGMPGYAQDARRAFADHMFHGARYLAKMRYADQLTRVLDDMQHYTTVHAQDAGFDPVKAQQVVDEAVKRHDAYMNPKTSKGTTALTSLGFVWFLGLSPASAVVNLTQTVLMGLPVLGGQFGFGKASAALLKASKDAVRAHTDMSRILRGDELRAFEEWVKAGHVDLTGQHSLAGVAAGTDTPLHGIAGKAMEVTSFMFKHAEQFNRQATLLAAYRLARAAGQSHAQASDTAVVANKASHFDYSAGARPRIMQGNLARVFLLFKQFGQNMIFSLVNNFRLSFGQRDPAVKLQARKTLSGMLVLHALAAGALGLPMVTTLLAAASMIGGGGDEPWDAEVALRNLLAEQFGEETGRILAHGLSRSSASPWDISKRVGLDSMIVPDLQEGLQGVNLAEAVLGAALGPVVSIGINGAKGFHTIGATGDWGRGLEEMAPSFMRGPLRALRYHAEGIKDKTGVDILPETTGAEEAGQALGFSPSRGREAQEAKSAIYQADQALKVRRTQLLGQFAHRMIEHEDPSEQLAAIAQWNQLHPNRVIAPLHLQHSIAMRMKHIVQAKQGIFLPPARGLDARTAGAFADGID